MKILIFHLTYAHSKKNQAPASSFISEGRGPEITKNMVRRLPGLGVPKRPPATSRKWRKGRLKKGLVFKRMKCLGSRLDLLHLTKRFKASILHTCTHSGPVWSPRSGPKSSPKSFPRRTQNPLFGRSKIAETIIYIVFEDKTRKCENNKKTIKMKTQKSPRRFIYKHFGDFSCPPKTT